MPKSWGYLQAGEGRLTSFIPSTLSTVSLCGACKRKTREERSHQGALVNHASAPGLDSKPVWKSGGSCLKEEQERGSCLNPLCHRIEYPAAALSTPPAIAPGTCLAFVERAGGERGTPSTHRTLCSTHRIVQKGSSHSSLMPPPPCSLTLVLDQMLDPMLSRLASRAATPAQILCCAGALLGATPMVCSRASHLDC